MAQERHRFALVDLERQVIIGVHLRGRFALFFDQKMLRKRCLSFLNKLYVLVTSSNSIAISFDSLEDIGNLLVRTAINQNGANERDQENHRKTQDCFGLFPYPCLVVHRRAIH